MPKTSGALPINIDYLIDDVKARLGSMTTHLSMLCNLFNLNSLGFFPSFSVFLVSHPFQDTIPTMLLFPHLYYDHELYGDLCSSRIALSSLKVCAKNFETVCI
ncbi:hypothetical protein AVEN_182937-1 [Araneus ventricosus]|uniref:Uncharacterized protein n=1 Tax=Araneus ventricosus TaxID=182803 RepID=A0A4Y2FRA7_ARAVE|nr:hypothetical protein AVEN_182937-1 [Araneus ventricosus]